MECGGDDFELDHFKRHNYSEYELFFQQRLILCDFCDVDFGSYDPSYFGFKKEKKIGIEHFNFIRDINNKEMTTDLYCTKCNYRLSFLKFVDKCRSENAKCT